MDTDEDDLASYWEILKGPPRAVPVPEPVPQSLSSYKAIYIATRSFNVGTDGPYIPTGALVFFDGINLEFNGQKYSHPALRGAVQTGWLVKTDQR